MRGEAVDNSGGKLSDRFVSLRLKRFASVFHATILAQISLFKTTDIPYNINICITIMYRLLCAKGVIIISQHIIIVIIISPHVARTNERLFLRDCSVKTAHSFVITFI